MQLRQFVLFFAIISLCYCQEQELIATSRKKHHHHLHHAAFYSYLAFIAVKIKIVLLIATVIMAMLFAGKLFALFRYATLEKSHNEPIILEKPHYDHSFDLNDVHDFPDRSDTRYTYYPQKFIAGARSLFYQPLSYEDLIKIFNKINITEMAFESLGITKSSCKKKIICKESFFAASNELVKITSSLLKDQNYEKYHEANVPKSLDDCYKWYSDCGT